MHALKTLRASLTDRMLCGVCGGLGEHSPVPAWLWRVAFALLALWNGYGVVLYLVIGVFMPQAANPATIHSVEPAADAASVPLQP